VHNQVTQNTHTMTCINIQLDSCKSDTEDPMPRQCRLKTLVDYLFMSLHQEVDHEFNMGLVDVAGSKGNK